MNEMSLFTVVGLTQLSAFKGAHNVMKASPPEWPAWALTNPGRLRIFFNLAGICYAATIAYGFAHLDWWIPLIAMIVGFPFAYYLAVRPIVGDIASMTIGTALSVVGAFLVVADWMS